MMNSHTTALLLTVFAGACSGAGALADTASRNARAHMQADASEGAEPAVRQGGSPPIALGKSTTSTHGSLVATQVVLGAVVGTAAGVPVALLGFSVDRRNPESVAPIFGLLLGGSALVLGSALAVYGVGYSADSHESSFGITLAGTALGFHAGALVAAAVADDGSQFGGPFSIIVFLVSPAIGGTVAYQMRRRPRTPLATAFITGQRGKLAFGVPVPYVVPVADGSGAIIKSISIVDVRF